MAGYKCVNFYDLCRLCTASYGVKIKIFSDAGNKRNLLEKIHQFLPVVIDESDQLPKILCTKCLQTVEMIAKFRETCQNAQTMLESCLNSSKLRQGGKVYIKDVGKKVTGSTSNSSKTVSGKTTATTKGGDPINKSKTSTTATTAATTTTTTTTTATATIITVPATVTTTTALTIPTTTILTNNQIVKQSPTLVTSSKKTKSDCLSTILNEVGIHTDDESLPPPTPPPPPPPPPPQQQPQQPPIKQQIDKTVQTPRLLNVNRLNNANVMDRKKTYQRLTKKPQPSYTTIKDETLSQVDEFLKMKPAITYKRNDVQKRKQIDTPSSAAELIISSDTVTLTKQQQKLNVLLPSPTPQIKQIKIENEPIFKKPLPQSSLSKVIPSNVVPQQLQQQQLQQPLQQPQQQQQPQPQQLQPMVSITNKSQILSLQDLKNFTSLTNKCSLPITINDNTFNNSSISTNDLQQPQQQQPQPQQQQQQQQIISQIDSKNFLLPTGYFQMKIPQAQVTTIDGHQIVHLNTSNFTTSSFNLQPLTTTAKQTLTPPASTIISNIKQEVHFQPDQQQQLVELTDNFLSPTQTFTFTNNNNSINNNNITNINNKTQLTTLQNALPPNIMLPLPQKSGITIQRIKSFNDTGLIPISSINTISTLPQIPSTLPQISSTLPSTSSLVIDDQSTIISAITGTPLTTLDTSMVSNEEQIESTLMMKDESTTTSIEDNTVYENVRTTNKTKLKIVDASELDFKKIYDVPACEVCDKVFKRKEHLTQHMKLHLGLRPFKCEESSCNKSFSRKEHLIRHIISHSGKKLFHCDVCQKLFSRKDNLNKHKRAHDNRITGFALVNVTPTNS